MNRLVIYHGNCIDGWASAWAFWKRFGTEDTAYVAANFGEPPPDVKGKEVVVLDFSYPREVMVGMNNVCKSLLVLDHHKTAQDALRGLNFAVFDMERSGAGITWDWVHVGEPRPALINYVEDRDLWRWKLPLSKQVNALIGAHKREDFEVWSRLAEALDRPGGVQDASGRGEAIEMYVDRYVTEMSAQSRVCKWLGYEIPVVNAPYISISELVSHLSKAQPFAVGWFQRKDGKYQYSLRSTNELDVSEIAKQFGGGGHKQSAGFELPYLIEEFR